MNANREIVAVVAGGAVSTMAMATAAQADPQEFAGFYGGLGISTTAGQFQDLDYDYGVSAKPDFSIFAGHNWAGESLVYGVELAYSPGHTYNGYDNDPGYSYGLTNMFDLRARVGTVIGESSMLYASLGYWTAQSIIEGDLDGNPNGISLGVGFQTNLDNGMFIGADLTGRQVMNYNEEGGGSDDKIRSPLVTAGVRIGFQF